MANGSTTLDMTCTLFRDSIYSTPGHGFYSISNTAQCAGNQTTIYGLGVQETSQLNCGVGLSERPVVA
ncbi:hypothetical protein BVRB_036520 [Beta vulgaris subsp. vulgaris]|uniref:Uncharacterized protein n=1 Tax=Beta vulgaris subsp. vulgaris TaxID=3555 RepID=A0A0J8BI46_BETVV|nr:hypothetical protein BVRB_036520 [Beta vulgaris subsp. vulgaris]